MKCRATFDRPSSSPASWKALTSPSNSDRWVCMPEPWTPSSGFGMNVAKTPRSRAISRTTRRAVMMLSAIDRASS